MPNRDIDSIINENAAKYNVDPKILKAQIEVESSGKRYAVSPAGAQGLAQLMPATARSLGVKDPFDPEQAINGQAKLMAENLKSANGDYDTALKMYHGSPNPNKWGVKTNSYPEKVFSKMQNQNNSLTPEQQKQADWLLGQEKSPEGTNLTEDQQKQTDWLLQEDAKQVEQIPREQPKSSDQAVNNLYNYTVGSETSKEIQGGLAKAAATAANNPSYLPAAIGAGLGSIVPGVGTAIGAGVGAGVGAIAGKVLGNTSLSDVAGAVNSGVNKVGNYLGFENQFQEAPELKKNITQTAENFAQDVTKNVPDNNYYKNIGYVAEKTPEILLDMATIGNPLVKGGGALLTKAGEALPQSLSLLSKGVSGTGNLVTKLGTALASQPIARSAAETAGALYAGKQAEDAGLGGIGQVLSTLGGGLAGGLGYGAVAKTAAKAGEYTGIANLLKSTRKTSPEQIAASSPTTYSKDIISDDPNVASVRINVKPKQAVNESLPYYLRNPDDPQVQILRKTNKQAFQQAVNAGGEAQVNLKNDLIDSLKTATSKYEIDLNTVPDAYNIGENVSKFGEKALDRLSAQVNKAYSEANSIGKVTPLEDGKNFIDNVVSKVAGKDKDWTKEDLQPLIKRWNVITKEAGTQPLDYLDIEKFRKTIDNVRLPDLTNAGEVRLKQIFKNSIDDAVGNMIYPEARNANVQKMGFISDFNKLIDDKTRQGTNINLHKFLDGVVSNPKDTETFMQGIRKIKSGIAGEDLAQEAAKIERQIQSHFLKNAAENLTSDQAGKLAKFVGGRSGNLSPEFQYIFQSNPELGAALTNIGQNSKYLKDLSYAGSSSVNTDIAKNAAGYVKELAGAVASKNISQVLKTVVDAGKSIASKSENRKAYDYLLKGPESASPSISETIITKPVVSRTLATSLRESTKDNKSTKGEK